ncbi:hypothetical protein DPMN_157674 [Dreissena polymorpha]|uniref:Uncharacterized protein n=1 Tax=Dreissena polymorpha TaxID=45954 RepID=A0A9D4EHM4_DREPO|nr:hypothetical protein DPMN_157674 [Dreissena polymorpha]
MALISASIDFGTTYSGWAYSFKHDYEKDPTDVKAKHWPAHQFISSKAPTIIILRSDGTTVEAFGYEAETRYLQLIETNRHTEYFCFHFFKMTLYNEKNIGKHTLIKDIAGREMRALDVFASAMKWLKDDLLSALNDKYTGGIHLTDIHWVITVPAIWSETAKQFMRIAAREAGIEMGRLNLALEPEAASIFCRHTNMQRSETSSSVDMSKFPPGTRYAVCDAGGRHDTT